ncbi:mitochondrial carrier domain-containing protein [Baffinella frigidus]|nr:mitochondrial carrier domain-containing protein [Cryptophyta sp. CCMP2293]
MAPGSFVGIFSDIAGADGSTLQITGGSASAMACLFSNPLEVVKTRLQVQGEMAASAPKKYTGLMDALVKIPREEGLRAIQKGLGPGMLYQFAMNGARLGSYPTLKKIFKEGPEHSPLGNALRQVARPAFS